MKKLLIFLLPITLFFSCKKHQPSFWFGGMEIIDTNQQFVRWAGEADYDWQINKYKFSAAQLALMKIDSNIVNWYLTSADTVTITPGTNPVEFLSDTLNCYYQFAVYTSSSCVFTYVLTDQYMNVINYGNATTIPGEIINQLVTIPAHTAKPGQA
jgi:hypothetical protein